MSHHQYILCYKMCWWLLHTVQNPQDQQQEDAEEEAATATATDIATDTDTGIATAGKDKDCFEIYSYSSCTCQRRKWRRQINDMKLMWEKSKENGVHPVAREVHVWLMVFLFLLNNQCYYCYFYSTMEEYIQPKKMQR